MVHTYVYWNEEYAISFSKIKNTSIKKFILHNVCIYVRTYIRMRKKVYAISYHTPAIEKEYFERNQIPVRYQYLQYSTVQYSTGKSY